MAFEFLDDFLGKALEIGESIFDKSSEFISELDTQDFASIATTGLAVSEAFSGADGESVSDALARVKSSGDALKTGAAITSSTQDVPQIELGADDDRTKAGRAATRDKLRVRRSFDPGTGLASNPLSIQI
jgi:hypothetical protein